MRRQLSSSDLSPPHSLLTTTVNSTHATRPLIRRLPSLRSQAEPTPLSSPNDLLDSPVVSSRPSRDVAVPSPRVDHEPPRSHEPPSAESSDSSDSPLRDQRRLRHFSHLGTPTKMSPAHQRLRRKHSGGSYAGHSSSDTLSLSTDSSESQRNLSSSSSHQRAPPVNVDSSCSPDLVRVE
jgi:hypothetical protein